MSPRRFNLLLLPTQRFTGFANRARRHSAPLGARTGTARPQPQPRPRPRPRPRPPVLLRACGGRAMPGAAAPWWPAQVGSPQPQLPAGRAAPAPPRPLCPTFPCLLPCSCTAKAETQGVPARGGCYSCTVSVRHASCLSYCFSGPVIRLTVFWF